MLPAREIRVPHNDVVRVFAVYADFTVRVDDNSPVHFDYDVRRTDSQGLNWILTFRVYGLDRKGRLMLFEHKWPHSYLQSPRRNEVIAEMVGKFAEPLNALPGRLEMVDPLSLISRPEPRAEREAWIHNRQGRQNRKRQPGPRA
ncbi:MAG: hypothetical protein HY247_06620 [archaeon]|nr:MAG: hypothetical protein HY247_06620 [archaeon]